MALGDDWPEYTKTQPARAIQINSGLDLPRDGRVGLVDDDADDWWVKTSHGVSRAKFGDWLAMGPSGQLYPIEQATFSETYEPKAVA